MVRVAILVVIVAGCGDNAVPAVPPAPPDAYERSGSCWVDGTTPRGVVELGTGTASFEPLPDPLPLEYFVTGGWGIPVNVKMSGLEPGNPDDILDPLNPRTRVLAFFADTKIPLSYAHCPNPFGYVSQGDGTFTWPFGADVDIKLCWDAAHLIGAQVQIDVDVVDHDGYVAHKSTTVTLGAPPGYYPMEKLPPCMP